MVVNAVPQGSWSKDQGVLPERENTRTKVQGLSIHSRFINTFESMRYGRGICEDVVRAGRFHSRERTWLAACVFY